MKGHRWIFAAAASLALVLPGVASARLRVDGELPEAKDKVSLHLNDASKQQALTELGKQAGWNLVQLDMAGPKVTLDVENAEAKDVLEAILADGDYVATAHGSLLRVARDSTPSAVTPPAPPALPTPPAPPLDQESDGVQKASKGDRTVLGGKLRVEAGEAVGDVSVTGGAADIYGTVEGDLVATGANVIVHPGGRVNGDAMAVGGRIHVEKGGHISGERHVVGGLVTFEDGDSKVQEEGAARNEHKPSLLTRAGKKTSEVFGNFTFLFVVGALFLAAAPNRMQRLRTALAERPLASVAHGVLASVAWVAATVILCITVVGIPFAAVLGIVVAFGMTAALAAAATTAGGALLGHRTQNQYAHLALGAGLFALGALLPWIGGLVQAAFVLAGLGVLGTTRMAGYLERKAVGATDPQGPYR